MKKKEAIEAFCQLITKVGTEAFLSTVEHDCICGENQISSVNPESIVVNDKIVQFIQESVELKLSLDKNLTNQ